MPQHSYKQLEEVYQRGVNKEHKPNPARTHPMSSRQGKDTQRCPQPKPSQRSIHKTAIQTVTKISTSQQ